MRRGVLGRPEAATRVMALLVIAVALGLAAVPVHATTYWIDGALGNDANPGSEAQPWQTFGKADTSGLQPGDVVMVKAGTYDSTSLGVLGFYLTQSTGTPQNPITYKAQGEVIITNTFAPNGGIGLLAGTKWTDFEGFIFDTCLYGFEFFGATGGTVRNCIARNVYQRSFAAVNSSDVNIIGNLAYTQPTGPDAYLVMVEGCTGHVNILNNTIDAASPTLGNACIVMYGGTCNSTVKNNILANAVYGVSHNQSAPALMDNSHNLFFNNTFDYLYNVSRQAGEINSNPQWANPGAGDYTLLPASIAINTGTDVGLTFNGPAPDMGAFETAITSRPGSASGVVTDIDTGNPLVNAKVSTVDGNTWGFTDETGAYSILLQPGNYTLRATRPGYSFQDKPAVINANANTSVSFQLTRVPPKTYYVNHATGNDGNTGLAPGSAWKTISRGDVLGILNPGDTILIAPGTYPQSTANGLELKNNSGEPGALIKYKADGGTVVIDQIAYQTGLTTDPTVYGIKQTVSYISYDGFEIRNAQYGIDFGVEHPGNEVINCYIHDIIDASGTVTSSFGIFAWLNSGGVFRNNVIANVSHSSGSSAGINVNESSAATILNNTVVNCGMWGILQGSAPPQPGQLVIKNNIIANNDIGLQLATAGNDNSHNLFFGNTTNYELLASPGIREFGGDPLLDGSYHLGAGSPAINTGTDVGLPFSGPAPDIGAFETASTAVPGGLVGTVTAGLPGSPPLPFAEVDIVGNPAFGISGLDGTYYVPLPTGVYTADASARGFVTQNAGGLNVTGGSLTTKDWTLPKGAWKTYYVDGTNGNNINDGLTPGTAWKDITFGDLDFQLDAGDTVVVLPGTYLTTGLGNETLNVAGSPLAPITYKAQGPGVIIDGQGSAFGWVLWTSYIDLEGFEMQNCTYAVDAVNSSSHEVRNCIVRDSVTAGLYTYNCSDVTFRNNLLVNTGNTATGLWAEGHTNFHALNNTVVGFDRGSYLITTSGEATVKNNIFQDVNTGIFSTQAGPLNHSHNLFWDAADLYGGNAEPGLAEIVADPMLDANFELTSGSPAIDAGTNVGLAFNGLAPDLGWVESAFSGTPANYGKISDVKGLADGTWVTVNVVKSVTADDSAFTDGTFNIEELDRASGIKLVNGSGVSLGDQITVTGMVSTDAAGEKVIDVSSITVISSEAPLEEIAVGTEAVGSGSGVSMSGLLLRTWGTVTYKAADNSHIYIDDGSALDDGSGRTGVRIQLGGTSSPITPIPAVGDYVVVTGLGGLIKDGSQSVPVVRPRGPADVTIQ